VFVNSRLAVDLGGMHTPLDGSVNVREAAASLGLTDGSVYEIVVFHAERQTTGSSFRLVLSGFAASPSVCSRT
jgi:fibro-slime domain-containing protein